MADSQMGLVVVVELFQPFLLLLVELCLVDKADVMLFQLGEDVVGGLGIFLAVLLVEEVDGLYRLFQFLLDFLRRVATGNDTIQGCHADTEKLIEVVGINA